MTYHKATGDQPAKLTCDMTTGYVKDPDSDSVTGLSAVMCTAHVIGGTAAQVRAVARERGWRVSHPGLGDRCAQHRPRRATNPTPYGRRRS